MASVSDPLLRDGLEALVSVLPKGYSVAPSSLNQEPPKGDAWIVIRRQAKQNAVCLVLARRRVEARDLGAIAAHAAKTSHPALLVSPYLSPTVRERLRGFGIGHWDLAGNARITIDDIGLCVERNTAECPAKGVERGVRSLCGEMAGRVARVLIDVKPPYALSDLAELARVEASCASRVVTYLGESGMLQRKPRGKIEVVRWEEVLHRWSLDAPLPSRGETTHFVASRGLPEVVARLRVSGFLHAVTGEVAFAHLAAQPTPARLVMYVEELDAAVRQFGLHPTDDEADVTLVKPLDRSVFQRSYEKDGLRYVSPSLMAADLESEQAFDRAATWMIERESDWRR